MTSPTATWEEQQTAPDRYVVDVGSQPDSLLCRIGLHKRTTIDAIDTYIGPFLNDRECYFPRMVGSRKCPGTARGHRHVELPWCCRCGSVLDARSRFTMKETRS